MRPIYETAEDRAAQRELSAICARKFGCSSIELPALSVVDFLYYQFDGPKVWVEVKKRDKTFNQYPTYIVSKGKWDAALILMELTKLPALWLVGFNDALAWVKVSKKEYGVLMSGRKDRGDPNDIEPCIHIPMDEFKRIEQ